MEQIRKEYHQEEKLEHVRQWQSSGKLPSLYSKEVGIPYTTLRNWINKYHHKKVRKHVSIHPSTDTQPSFLSIQLQEVIAAPHNINPLMELVFSNGSRLNFYQTVSIEYLQSLLSYAQH